jgi:hypothetical protein
MDWSVTSDRIITRDSSLGMEEHDSAGESTGVSVGATGATVGAGVMATGGVVGDTGAGVGARVSRVGGTSCGGVEGMDGEGIEGMDMDNEMLISILIPRSKSNISAINISTKPSPILKPFVFALSFLPFFPFLFSVFPVLFGDFADFEDLPAFEKPDDTLLPLSVRPYSSSSVVVFASK